MTDHEQTALAALVAWIDAEMLKDREEGMNFLSPDTYVREQTAKNVMRLAGCLVIAERAAAVGR